MLKGHFNLEKNFLNCKERRKEKIKQKIGMVIE